MKKPPVLRPLRNGCVALQFLTRLPVPRALLGDATSLSATLPWFPLVGLLIGGLLALEDAVLGRTFGVLVVSALLVVSLLGITGALHLDGLMDAADALLGHATPDRRLQIMRDPRVGSFGVAAAGAVILLKAAAIASLPAGQRPTALVLAPLMGRWGITLAVTAFPYARPVGLGTTLKAGASAKSEVLPSLIAVVASVLLMGAFAGGLLVGGTVVLTFVLGRWITTRIPGLTGDCYGAICELVETAVLVLLPLLLTIPCPLCTP